MSWSAAMVASLFATLGRPRWWPLALAGFLVRGGIVAFVLPIVVLPTPAGLSNLLAPTLTGFVFGGPSPTFVALVAAIAAGLAVWLLLGGFAGARLEVELARDVAGSDELSFDGDGLPADPGRGVAALLIRLVSLAPLAALVVAGAPLLVAVTYHELVSPGDLAVPVALRVLGQIPGIVAAILIAWLVGEAAGGLAVRRLVLDGCSPSRALVGGWGAFVRRPSTLATTILTDAVVLALLALTLLVVGTAWRDLRLALAVNALAGGEALVVFVASWLAGLVLTSVAAAWRSAAWTFEAARRHVVRQPSLPHRHVELGRGV